MPVTLGVLTCKEPDPTGFLGMSPLACRCSIARGWQPISGPIESACAGSDFADKRGLRLGITITIMFESSAKITLDGRIVATQLRMLQQIVAKVQLVRVAGAAHMQMEHALRVSTGRISLVEAQVQWLVVGAIHPYPSFTREPRARLVDAYLIGEFDEDIDRGLGHQAGNRGGTDMADANDAEAKRMAQCTGFLGKVCCPAGVMLAQHDGKKLP